MDTAKAGELLGMKLIYLEAGSGAKQEVSQEIIKAVKQEISIPLIVGGGITSKLKLEKAYMKISVDLTLSPLQDDYEQHVIDFIKALRVSEFTVLENPLSTQIYGDYDELMPFLTKSIKTSFKNQDICVLTMKVVKTDRSDYESTF